MNNQIVDLILPDTLDKKKALKELKEKYKRIIEHNRIEVLDNFFKYAKNYVKELDEIENKVHYNREFWIKVAELNKDVLTKINMSILVYSQDLYFGGNYNFNEFDLINEQFRFLQEIYYKGKNEAKQ